RRRAARRIAARLSRLRLRRGRRSVLALNIVNLNSDGARAESTALVGLSVDADGASFAPHAGRPADAPPRLARTPPRSPDRTGPSGGRLPGGLRLDGTRGAQRLPAPRRPPARARQESTRSALRRLHAGIRRPGGPVHGARGYGSLDVGGRGMARDDEHAG